MKTLTKWGVCMLAAVAMSGCASMGGGMSDEEMIQELIIDAMAALVAQDIEGMTAAYAPDFESDQGGGVEETREFLQGAKEQGFLDGIVVDTEPMEIVVEGDTATAGPIDLEGAFGSLSLEFELEKRDGQWYVVYQSQY